MTITIREPKDSDFFPWLSLYEGYAAARGAELTEEKALLLWTWVSDPANAEKALIAVDDEGNVSGLAHFHAFPRPLEGDTGVFLDALYVQPDAGESSTGQELLDAVRQAATAGGSHVIRWTRADGEDLPAVLGGVAGEPTQPATYELQTAAQPA